MKNYKELRQNFRQRLGEELDIMHTHNNEVFESSSEGEYWKKRSNKRHKQSQSPQKFKSLRNFKNARRTKKCHGDKFKKGSKWYGYDEKYFDFDAFEYVVKDNVNTIGQKNRVFCRGCHKYKFIFSSQKKADNYILYNAETIRRINGYSPVRSYYCHVCRGWHTTHQEMTLEELRESILLPEVMFYDSLGLDSEIEEFETNRETEFAKGFEKEIENGVEAVDTDLTQENNQVAQVIPEEDQKTVLLKEIEKIFEDQIAEFDKALQSRDIKKCTNINARLRRIFSSFEINCEAMATFYARLDQMSLQLKELEQRIEAETNMLKKEIWNIQKIFKAQMQLFTKKLSLGYYEECRTIYDRLSNAINSFAPNMSFVKDFKRRLEEMETRLNNCGTMVKETA